MKYKTVTLAVAVVGMVLLLVYQIISMPVERLILCAADESDSLYPASVCNFVLVHHRAGSDDIEALSAGAGLDFILNLDSQAKFKISDVFLQNGLGVDSVNNFTDQKVTALQASVIYEDAKRVEYLLSKGADAHLKNRDGLTALDFADRKIKQANPSESTVQIHKLLSEK